jgi:hypothetical protein
VVSSIAFGATVVRSIVTPTSSATPVMVGDDETPAPALSPTAGPTTTRTAAPTTAVTEAPTEEPTTAAPTHEPTRAPVKTSEPVEKPDPTANAADLGALRVTDNGTQFTFCWDAYTGGTEFSYYKVSGVPYPDQPGYAETGVYWDYVGPGTASITIPVKPGKIQPGTWNVNVEAIYYPDGVRTALARTSAIKLKVAGGPAGPTAPPVASLTLTVDSVGPNTLSAAGVHLSWTKYAGSYFSYYGIVRSEGAPTLAVGEVPSLFYTDNISNLSFTDTSARPGHTYRYKLWAFSERTFGNVVPNCAVGTILAVSNTVEVAIPVSASPTPAPTRTPVQNLGALIANDTLSGVAFSWTGYHGDFSYYKLVYETTASHKTPSFPGGSRYWAAPPVGATTAGPIAIPAGDYQVRIQAIGFPDGSTPHVYAQTTVIHIHMSAATASALASAAAH